MAVFFPLAAQGTSELAVSTRRMDKFFRLPEVEYCSNTNTDSEESGHIEVKDGNYGWYAIDSDDKKKKKEKSKHKKSAESKV